MTRPPPLPSDPSSSADTQGGQVATTQQHLKWLAPYVIVSSILILVLLIVVIAQGVGGQSARSTHVESHTESLDETRARTTELERQRQTQVRLLEDQRVAAELEAARQEKEAKRRAAIAMIEGLEGQLSILRQSLAATQAEKDAYATKTRDYAMDHKMAIAAMGVTVGGGAMALDESNQFTDDQKAIAGVSAVVAGLYALSNAEECAEVAERMAKAATMQADYDSRISKTKSQINSIQSQVDQAKADLPQ